MPTKIGQNKCILSNSNTILVGDPQGSISPHVLFNLLFKLGLHISSSEKEFKIRKPIAWTACYKLHHIWT